VFISLDDGFFVCKTKHVALNPYDRKSRNLAETDSLYSHT